MVQNNISMEALCWCHQHCSKDILEVFDTGLIQPSFVHDEIHTQRFCLLISACSESDHKAQRGSVSIIIMFYVLFFQFTVPEIMRDLCLSPPKGCSVAHGLQEQY